MKIFFIIEIASSQKDDCGTKTFSKGFCDRVGALPLTLGIELPSWFAQGCSVHALVSLAG